ncbi:unnamed protein product, partial [Sphacelaria rigidula]
MPGTFVPAGYDLYGPPQSPQAASFLGAGIEGLPPGAAAHQLMPYLQAQQQAQVAQQQQQHQHQRQQQIGAAGAGDGMRIPHHPLWYPRMATPGVGADTAALGGMAGNMAMYLQQQQLMQRRLQLHHL